LSASLAPKVFDILPSVASVQTFGYVPGMQNNGLDPITEPEIRTLRQIAEAGSLDDSHVQHIERLKRLGYVKDTDHGLRLTPEGMMWVVGGTDD
jgi:hypothetical protein